MFLKKPTTEKSGLETIIDEHLAKMQDIIIDPDEYATMVLQLDTLYKLKEIDKPERISKDTLAIIAGNIAGILLIVSYEQKNVLTSKAINFIQKLR